MLIQISNETVKRVKVLFERYYNIELTTLKEYSEACEKGLEEFLIESFKKIDLEKIISLEEKMYEKEKKDENTK